MDSTRKTELLHDAIRPYFRVTGLVITAFLLLFLVDVLPSDWHVDRLVAFFVGQSFFGFFIFTPLYLVQTIDVASEDDSTVASPPVETHNKNKSD